MLPALLVTNPKNQAASRGRRPDGLVAYLNNLTTSGNLQMEKPLQTMSLRNELHPHPAPKADEGTKAVNPPEGGNPPRIAESSAKSQLKDSPESLACLSASKNHHSFVIPEEINHLTVAQAARVYPKVLNVAVIPQYPITSRQARKPGKQPMIRNFRQKALADMTEDYFAEWFPERTDRNLGAILSDPLIWIDADAKQDEGASADEWLEQNPEFQNHPRVRTKHGFHIPIVVPDLPTNVKKLAHTVNQKLVIELIPPTHPVTLPPSLRIDGKPYVWEKTGEFPEYPYQELLKRLGVEMKEPGRPRKPPPLSQQFKGDLKTFRLADILREKSMLGNCIDEEEAKWGVRCPWENEHSERHQDIGSDTVIWNKPGSMPGFHCSHAHCNGRGPLQLLKWLEDNDPGVVDRFCQERRVYDNTEKENGKGKLLVKHAGNHRLVSEVAEELATIIAPRFKWFQRDKGVFEITLNPKTGRPVFGAITPVSAVAGIEEFVSPVVPKTTGKDEETVLVPLSFSVAELAPLLQAPQFLRLLPIIERILPISLPILKSDGTVAQPGEGYDPEFRIYLDSDAPQIVVMTVEQAKEILNDILGDFCFASPQDKIHAIARLITP